MYWQSYAKERTDGSTVQTAHLPWSNSIPPCHMTYPLNSRYQVDCKPTSRAMACFSIEPCIYGLLYLRPIVKGFKTAIRLCKTFIEIRKECQRTQKRICWKYSAMNVYTLMCPHKFQFRDRDSLFQKWKFVYTFSTCLLSALGNWANIRIKLSLTKTDIFSLWQVFLVSLWTVTAI